MSQSPVRKAVGMVLVVLGGIWVLLAGGCTLAVLVQSLGSSGQGAAAFLLIGLFCVAPGALMLWLGLRMTKTAGGS